ncbi:TonB-dependent receptor [Flavobacteriaceae bacterium MHTCC 0001]
MKKITHACIMLTILLFSIVAMAQTTITGTVVEAGSNLPLPGANVVEKGTGNGVSTDFDGNFTLETTSSSGEIEVSYVGYASVIVAFSGTTNLGQIVIESDNSLDEIIIVGTGVIDLAGDRKTPVAVSTISRAQIQEKAVGNVEVTEIIKSTPSTFVSGQTGFGDSQITLRGFGQTNIATLLNGQPINSPEDGRVFWSNWAGIADVANGVQVQRGLGSSKLAISSVGGTINLVMKSSDRQKGGFVRFLGGNDSFFKGTVSYDTGINDKGWSFSVLLDHWQGHRKWAEGTYGQGQTYFLSAGYKPNDKHQLNFLITGAPQFHGQRWSQSLEIIATDPKFNQHWGYTADGIDSERQNYYHKPVINLNWDWNMSEKSDLSSVLYASLGRGGGTGPRGARTPRTADPDGDGPLRGQVDFAGIEALNASVGLGDNATRSGYIRRASVNNHQWVGLVSNFGTTLVEDKLSLNVGTDIRFYTGDHFRQIADLYGLTGWDNDNSDNTIVTATFAPKPWASLFSFADEKDRIDYDYSEDINYQGVFAQTEYSNDRFSVYFQGALSNQSYQRDGRFNNLGKSEKISKIGYNLKGGASVSFAENYTLFTNIGYYSRQPFLDNVFKDIRSSNELFKNPEVENEDIKGIEFGYRYENANFRATFNFYHTDWANRVDSDFDLVDLNAVPTPDDTSDDTEINIFERNLRQVHTGIELDLNYRPSSDVTVNGYMSFGSWKKKGTVIIDTFNDETGDLISSESGINVDGIKITGAPQFTAGLNARVKVIEDFFLYGNIDYYSNQYINNEREPTENLGTLQPYSLTDLGLTYNFNLGDNRLTFSANVFNVLDKIAIQSTDRFGFFNTNGRTFNASLKYLF